MKFENKGMLELFISVFSVLFLILMIFKLWLFGILVFIMDLVIIVYYIIKLRDNRNEFTKYQSEVRNILKTYDSILVEVKDFPSISGLKVVNVTNFKDMVDAQYELRKPIYFKEYDNSCGFLLLGDKEACVFILKLSSSIKCPLEKTIYMYNLYDTGNIEDFFDRFDKTGVIKLSNNKSFRISPVKKQVEPNIINHNKLDVNPNFVSPAKVLSQESLEYNKTINTNNNTNNNVNINSNDIVELPELKR